MTNPGPSICPKCGATMETTYADGVTYTYCPACKYTIARAGRWAQDADRMYNMFWDADLHANPVGLPPVDEPHAGLPPVDGALLCCILDQDMSPTTLAGTLVWVYNLRGYSKDTVDSMNHYRERGVRMLLSNLWEDVYGQ